MRLWSGGSDDSPSGRSRGHKSRSSDGNRGGHGPSRRNPLTVAEDEGQDAQFQPRPRDRHAPALADLEAPTPDVDRGEKRRRKHHASGNERPAATSAKGLSLTHVAFLLVGLALGAAILITTQHLYKALGKSKHEAPAAVAAAPTPPPPAAAPPAKPVRLAGDPVEAIRLMLQAAGKGDTATAYAQWDIGPDDLATLKRGQELTVAEVVANAQRDGDRLRPDKVDYRLMSQSGNEARVGQFTNGACAQVFSLRKKGSSWKLYNASSP